jgi:uncharacterized protein YdeI (YjbR/CyaY-like superfamily)
MGKYDARVDAYIAKAEPFAQPILSHLRALVHKACPAVEETIKWGFPVFEYKGILCNMASFKKHCVFGFWKAALMSDKSLEVNAKSEVAMGHMGKLTTMKDLPADSRILKNIREAATLNEQGIKVEKKKPIAKKPVALPPYFKKALASNDAALNTFEAFSPSHQREYIEWITEAKTEATREKRMEQAIEWLAEGKPRNWKYMKK